jgi:starch synthase (maltosyl-transferring)
LRRGPRIYNLFPSLVGSVDRWTAELPRIAAMGFDWVYVNPFHYPGFSGSLYAVKDYYRLNPLFDECGQPAELQLGSFTAAARELGLAVMMDLVINHTARDALLTAEHHGWFARRPNGDLRSPTVTDVDDPAVSTEWGDLAEIDYGDPSHHPDMIAHWRRLVEHYLHLGFGGFRCDAATKVPAVIWGGVIGAVRESWPQVVFAAETLGCEPAAIAALRQAGFDYLFNSACWWDFHAPWLLEQYDVMRVIAPSIAFPESHDTERLAALADQQGNVPGNVPGNVEDWCRLRVMFSAFFSAGWMMPMGCEWGWRRRLDVVNTRPDPREEAHFDLAPFITEVNRLKADLPALNEEGGQWRLTPASSPVVALLRRPRSGEGAAVLVMNTDFNHAHAFPDVSLPGLVDATPGGGGEVVVLPPLAFRLLTNAVGMTAAAEGFRLDPTAPGIVIQAVTPSVGCGRWPVKRDQGEVLEVGADIVVDGHVILAARVLYRGAGEGGWQSASMVAEGNDRWSGRVPLTLPGRLYFTVEAWIDAYETWRADLVAKRQAEQPVTLELSEGRHLVQAALTRIEGEDRERLEQALQADAVDSALVRSVMARWPDFSRSVRAEGVGEVVIDRPIARFGAWYGMTARSQGDRPGRSATFRDCERRLPEIARMGFDVVYLLPIHPIGRVHRKGPDNALVAGPDDPGSPYAIGSVEGGHAAIHPGLGTLEDFRHFVAAVQRHGMEVALDFAIQCAPDHPWVQEHPQWFVWRPDGSLRYAENPPKKYQDIVNLDFHGPAAAELWRELRAVVLFWVAEGVRIFRVDNPHTKPLPFWEWLIRSVRDAHPDVVFLSEAFTRPKLMMALAKVGFSQSYTYFTWRNFKAEIQTYLGELTSGEAREVLRPNFWPATPDILPVYLQTGGRAAFRIRLILAATLSPAYGIPNGYELCEAEAVPGHEEYLHSEKYQYKVWDWNRAGHIKDDITRINAIRRDNPALHDFANLRFLEAEDDAVLFYSKMTADRSNMILVVVTLDPFDAHDVVLHFPLAAMGVPPGETFDVEELLSGRRHLWRGACHHVHLDPQVNPAAVFRVTVWTSVAYRTPCL